MNIHETVAGAFPLVRAGGVFLVIVGAATMVGAAFIDRRYLFLAIGAGAAAMLTAALAIPLSAPYGRPTEFQLGALVVALVAEIAGIAIAGSLFAKRSERQHTLSILMIVGVHFAIMTPAFGPPIAVLAVATTLNAAMGLAFAEYPLSTVWLADGALKTAAGLAMNLGHYLPLHI